MSFIRRVVGPDEQLIGISSVHWIYGFKGLMALALFSLAGAVIRGMLTPVVIENATLAAGLGVIGGYVFWTALLIGGLIFLFYIIVMISTEIGLTTKRVIFKRGLIAVDVREIDLEEIKAADVNNGLFGRFLNYGYLWFDARFVDNLQLPAISDPYRYIKAMNDARSRLKSDTMQVILNDKPGNKTVESVDSDNETAEHSSSMAHNSPAPDAQDPRYSGLSNNPMDEIRRMSEDLSYHEKMQSSQTQKYRRKNRQKAHKQMKPVIFANKTKLHDKLLDSFRMISNYGNKYEP